MLIQIQKERDERCPQAVCLYVHMSVWNMRIGADEEENFSRARLISALCDFFCEFEHGNMEKL